MYTLDPLNLLGNYLLKKDVVAEGYDPIIAEEITFRAAIGGILGSKIYYLIETIPTGQAANNFNGLIEIMAGIFTLSVTRIAGGIQNFGAGLVFLGGLIGGLITVIVPVASEVTPVLLTTIVPEVEEVEGENSTEVPLPAIPSKLPVTLQLPSTSNK